MRARMLASMLVAVLGVACAEAEPEEVEVRYKAYSPEGECVDFILVERPAEYWISDMGCTLETGELVDPEGRCVFVPRDCGPDVDYYADPYFSSCDTLPGCCDMVWTNVRCE